MLDEKSSLRIELLRFPLIVGVVFIHAYSGSVVMSGVEVGGQTNWISDFFRNLISNGFARSAVPLFFMISGFLFFLGRGWSLGLYFSKLKSRVGTLLIPYVFWNSITLLFLALAQKTPMTQSYFSGVNKLISDFQLYDYANAILGLSGSPISYQFWFIHNLMILVILLHKSGTEPLFHVMVEGQSAKTIEQCV